MCVECPPFGFNVVKITIIYKTNTIMTEQETRNEIARLRMQADAMEAQMFADHVCSMGFEPWGSSERPNEGEALITIRRDRSFGFIPGVAAKYWSWYDLDYWARPQDLSPRAINEAKTRMDGSALEAFREWLGEPRR